VVEIKATHVATMLH